jgi:two-component sensor histidine kinase
MVAKSLAKVPILDPEALALSSPNLGYESPSSGTPVSAQVDKFLESWPCVIYLCDSALEISYLSKNIVDLIGVPPEEFLGSRALWESIVLQDDLPLVLDRLGELERYGVMSFTHRILDKRGLPLWVYHSAKWATSRGKTGVRGCIMPLWDRPYASPLEATTVSHFVHRMGNQFQLMNLIVSSLRKTHVHSQEQDLNALEETLEKAIELTRTFGEYSQNPTLVSAVELAEIIDAAVVTRSSLFVQKNVKLTRDTDQGLQGLAIDGDPYLLELAIGGVVENALEATDHGGEVAVHARLERFEGQPCAAKLTVTDSGCGIEAADIDDVKSPFFSTKPDRHGLGLSIAARAVELHGGILRVISRLNKGTEVQITLPVNARRDNSCR